MTLREDPRLMEAKAFSVTEVVARLGIAGLRQAATELSGPCPLCGGRDRFNINLRSHAFLCRRCDIAGGDNIALVQKVLNVDFKAALQFLCGDAPAQIDPKEMARRRARAKAAERKRAEEAEVYRRRSIADARAIWSRARPGALGVVRAYLTARGISPEGLPQIPPALRFIADHPYVKKIGGRLETAHRGPAMIAGVLDAQGDLTAVHQTWVDLTPPHGKAVITWGGESLPAKMVRGSKKGGAIRLITPESADTLVVGEGIETTLSAFAAGVCPGAAFWAGVDLGNMAGRAARVPGQRWHGRPDLDDADAFVPPSWVRTLIYLQDGDSDPQSTRHKLLCGLRRAMALRPGLTGRIVAAPEGKDFNDVLKGEDDQDDD